MAKADAISGGGTLGDGILMAQAIGADTLDTTYIKASYGFKLKPTIIQDMSLITYSGAIMINKEGKRFTDESQSYKLQGDASLSADRRVLISRCLIRTFLIMTSRMIRKALK